MTEPVAMSVNDAAKSLSVHPNTIYNWLREGTIQGRRVGGRRLISAESVRRLFEAA